MVHGRAPVHLKSATATPGAVIKPTKEAFGACTITA